MEATFTVRAATSEQVKKAVAKLSLQKNEIVQYTHNTILIFKKQHLQILAGQFYHGNREGMKHLLSSTTNKPCKVKSNKVHTCTSIPKASKKSADAAITSSKTITSEITFCADAQEKAKRQNMSTQAV